MDEVVELRAKAHRWLELGAVPSALRQFEEILLDRPDDVDALRAVAVNAQDIDAVDRSFRRLEALSPLTVEEYLTWSDALARAGRVSQARHAVDMARSVATTPEERLAAAERVVVLPGPLPVDEVLKAADSAAGGAERRAAAVLAAALQRAAEPAAVTALAERFTRLAPKAPTSIGLDAVDRLLTLTEAALAHAVWMQLERPSNTPADRSTLIRYLTSGGQAAFRSEQPLLAAGRYQEAIDQWSRLISDLADSPDVDLRDIRIEIARLRFHRILSLTEAGRFDQAVDEARLWEEEDSPRGGTSREPDAAGLPPDPEASSRWLRQLSLVGALGALGENRRALAAVIDVTRGAPPFEDEPFTMLFTTCFAAADADAAQRALDAVPAASAAVHGRDAVLTQVNAYRLCAERYPSFAPAAGNVIRQALTDPHVCESDPRLEALLALYAGQHLRAREVLRKVPGRAWEDEVQRAVVELVLGDARRAARHCDEALAQRPFDGDIELLRAEIERELHGAASARAMAEDITRRRPYDVDAQLLTADCCYEIARDSDGANPSRTDISLLTEAADRYGTAIELSDNMERFLESGGTFVREPMGTHWLSPQARQRAALRGATCLLRADALLERRRLPSDAGLRKRRRQLIDAVDEPSRSRLERAVWQNRWMRVWRWLRNLGLWVGLIGGLIALVSIVFPGIPVGWRPEDKVVLLIVFVVLALFPTISEFSLPGGVGIKRAAPPPLNDQDLQASELQRPESPIAWRTIALHSADPPSIRRTVTGPGASEASRGAETRPGDSSPDASDGADILKGGLVQA